MEMASQATRDPFEEAQARRQRDGRRAPDLCIEEYMALQPHDPRRQQLTRVIAALSLM